MKVAGAGETHEHTDMRPGIAKSARSEGYKEIADEDLQCETETKTAACRITKTEKQTARKFAGRFYLERANGIEPSALAWEARVLPLYDARMAQL